MELCNYIEVYELVENYNYNVENNWKSMGGLKWVKI